MSIEFTEDELDELKVLLRLSNAYLTDLIRINNENGRKNTSAYYRERKEEAKNMYSKIGKLTGEDQNMNIKLSKQELETLIDALAIAGEEYSKYRIMAINSDVTELYSDYEQKKTEAYLLRNKLQKEKGKHSCDIGSLTADDVEPRKKFLD